MKKTYEKDIICHEYHGACRCRTRPARFDKNLPKEEYDISLYVLINRGELFDEVPDYVHILNKKPE